MPDLVRLSSQVLCSPASGRDWCSARERANPARITSRVLCPQVRGAALAAETRPSPTPDAVRSCRPVPRGSPVPPPVPSSARPLGFSLVLRFLLFLLSRCYPEPYNAIFLHRTPLLLSYHHQPCRSKQPIPNKLKILLRPHFNLLHVKFLLGASADRHLSMCHLGWDHIPKPTSSCIPQIAK